MKYCVQQKKSLLYKAVFPHKVIEYTVRKIIDIHAVVTPFKSGAWYLIFGLY
ncbi:hypothetical protein [Bartonella tribocorum]|uniref:hypothetical protein n=1 Tax=Bartonella tribocorum TaxID=85701 RepID=UPI001AECD029|nr:hypothetical protein [Bartonella tribocorum]